MQAFARSIHPGENGWVTSELILPVDTADGWRLSVFHRPASGPPKQLPILMVHGLGATHVHFDLNERYSLAKAAAARGFAVYMLELRGAPSSEGPNGYDYNWGFNEHATHDMPKAIETILEHAGASRLHGVGHSMGGMLFFHQAVKNNPAIASITAIGTPLVSDIKLGKKERRLMDFGGRLTPGRRSGRVPLRKMLQAATRLIPIGVKVTDGMIVHLPNCDRDVVLDLADRGVMDIPYQIVQEIRDEMTGEGSSGPYEFESHLDKVQVPVLLVGGGADRIAPAESVRAAAARVQSRDVRYREMGKAHGDLANYGHVDLLIGYNAPNEVYPLVLNFVEEQDESGV